MDPYYLEEGIWTQIEEQPYYPGRKVEPFRLYLTRIGPRAVARRLTPRKGQGVIDALELLHLMSDEEKRLDLVRGFDFYSTLHPEEFDSTIWGGSKNQSLTRETRWMDGALPSGQGLFIRPQPGFAYISGIGLEAFQTKRGYFWNKAIGRCLVPMSELAAAYGDPHV
jgi:hypothetical protein